MIECPCAPLNTIELGCARSSSANRVEVSEFKIPQTARRINNRNEYFDLRYISDIFQ